jgi:hypothetical protein
MHRPILVLTASLLLIAPAVSADPLTDQQSPELKQCIQECRYEKDAADREMCDIKCVKADAARQKQDAVRKLERRN